VKSQLTLLTAILEDSGVAVGYNPKKDISTLMRRFEHEGARFVDITLPTLDDFLLEGLSTGRLPTDMVGWSRVSVRDRRPKFLKSLWSRIFDHDGVLMDLPCIESIRYIRQISRTYKKVFEVCEPRFVEKAVGAFVDTEIELSALPLPSTDAMGSVMKTLFATDLNRFSIEDMVFSHGPGAVAERAEGVNKYSFDVVPDELIELVGPEVFRATWYDLWNRPIKSGMIPARLVTVPKTATKPRLISIEPAYNQFIQQGIKDFLYTMLEKTPYASLSSQEPNRALALKGSRDGELVTVDLSESSDRVHNGIVQKVFGFNRGFLRAIQACRSPRVELPDGRILELTKYASMGSALTFPIEVMYFAAIVFLTIGEVEGDLSPKFIRLQAKRKDIRIYGDDIIVPRKYYPRLVENLTSFGLKVNTSKSFSTGLFRESCGMDAFMGTDITPVYARKLLPTANRDVDEIISASAFQRQFFERYGSGHTTDLVSNIIRRYCNPAVTQPGCIAGTPIHLYSDLPSQKVRWSSLQRLEQLASVPRYRRPKVTAEYESNYLFKTLYEGFNEDPDHLTHRGRPTSSLIQRRWVAIY